MKLDAQFNVDLVSVYNGLTESNLMSNVAELELFGFTVLENVVSADLVQILSEIILRRVEEKTGCSVTKELAEPLSGVTVISQLLYDHPGFAQLVTEVRVSRLMAYLLGRRHILSALASQVKAPGGTTFTLHTDTANNIPDPLPPYSQVATASFVLTENTVESGCLFIVPGSHRRYRNPRAWEMISDGFEGREDIMPIQVPVGAAVIWQGSTWHGSYIRSVPGLRLNVTAQFCREYLQPQERYDISNAPSWAVETRGLMRLLGTELVHGWGREGPGHEFARHRQALNSRRSWSF